MPPADVQHGGRFNGWRSQSQLAGLVERVTCTLLIWDALIEHLSQILIDKPGQKAYTKSMIGDVSLCSGPFKPLDAYA